MENNNITIVLEADDFNDSAVATSASKRIQFSSYKVSGCGKDEVADEVMISTLAEGLNVVVDGGAGANSIEILKTISNTIDEMEVWIPLDPSFENMQNAIDTAKAVKYGVKKVLIFQNYSNMSEFWAIFGNLDFGIEPNFEFLNFFDETMQVPRSSLFGLAKLYRTTLYDLSDVHQSYNFNAVKGEWALLGREEFKKRMSRHRLSVAAHEYLEAIVESRKVASEWS